MWTKKKGYPFVLIMLFLAGHVLGQIEVKAAGNFLIPSAGGARQYKGVITFTQAGIEIECQEKIFQRFNEFDTPRQRKLTITPADLYEIWLLKKKQIYLFPRWSFYYRYRNIFFHISRRFDPFSNPHIEKALVFTPDNPGDIDDEGEKLIKFLNKEIQAIGKSN